VLQVSPPQRRSTDFGQTLYSIKQDGLLGARPTLARFSRSRRCRSLPWVDRRELSVYACLCLRMHSFVCVCMPLSMYAYLVYVHTCNVVTCACYWQRVCVRRVLCCACLVALVVCTLPHTGKLVRRVARLALLERLPEHTAPPS